MENLETNEISQNDDLSKEIIISNDVYLLENEILKGMFDEAVAAMEMAYAPYSHFKVGACIRTPNNQIFSGCNVENCNFALAQCAEASAISNMVRAGQVEISEILIVAHTHNYCTPCGACRQKILEFSHPETTIVHMCNREGIKKSMLIKELLPEAFNKDMWIANL